MAIKKPIIKKINKNKTDSKGKKPSNPKANFQWKRAGKTSAVWLLIVVGAILISGLFSNSNKKEIEG